MNIGVDIRCLSEPFRSGVGTFAFELLNSIFLNDQKNTYILFGNSARSESDRLWKQEHVLYVHSRIPNKLFHTAAAIGNRPYIDELLEKKTGLALDLFFSPNLHFTPLKKTPHILTVHDLSFELYPEFLSLRRKIWHKAVQAKKQCLSARAIVVPSQHTADDLASHYGIARDKIHVVYPGCSLGQTEAAHANGAREPQQTYLLTIATVEPRKNIEGVIAAYQKSGLCAEGVLLKIAGGPGWKSGLALRQMKETPGVHYLGYVSEEEKQTLLAQSRAFIFPSFYEGFGMPVIEAMAMGVPVLTSDRSSLTEITEGAAYLVNPYNTAAIAAGMRRLALDEQVRSRAITAGMQVAKQYNWTNTKDQLINLFSL